MGLLFKSALILFRWLIAILLSITFSTLYPLSLEKTKLIQQLQELDVHIKFLKLKKKDLLCLEVLVWVKLNAK